MFSWWTITVPTVPQEYQLGVIIVRCCPPSIQHPLDDFLEPLGVVAVGQQPDRAA